MVEKGSNRPQNSLAADIRSLIVPVYLPMVLLMFGQGSVLPVLPLYAQQLGAGLGLTGLVVALKAVGTLCMEFPAGRLASKYGERRLLLAAVLITGLSALAAGWIRLIPVPSDSEPAVRGYTSAN